VNLVLVYSKTSLIRLIMPVDFTDAKVPPNPSPELQVAIKWLNLFVDGDVEGAFKLVSDRVVSRCC
jgi:hypothetical protein